MIVFVYEILNRKDIYIYKERERERERERGATTREGDGNWWSAKLEKIAMVTCRILEREDMGIDDDWLSVALPIS